MSQPEYVLGTGEQESVRLGLQHRLWSAAAHRLWERAGIRPGMTVLDLGSGPGHATIDLAEIVGPTGRVVAIDESPLFLKQLHDHVQGLHLRNVDRILGDVQQSAELAPHLSGRVDLAYARWVMCFVPDPEAVIRGVAGLLKPGARLAVQDYFNYEAMTIAPKCEAFSRVIRAIGKSWRERGGNPDIIAGLPGLLRRHGLEVEHLEVNQRIARPRGTMWAWPDSFWASFIPRLVQMGHLTREEQKAFEAAWSEASDDPDCFMLLPPVFDVVAVRR